MKGLVFGALMLGISSAAWSGCKPENIAGNWVASVAVANAAEADFCVVQVTRNGVVSGSCLDVLTAQQAPILGGTMTLNTSCLVTGNITFFSGVTAYPIAQLAKNKQIGTGVFANNAGYAGSFTMVRQ